MAGPTIPVGLDVYKRQAYPIPLYEGETDGAADKSGNPKVFSEPLTVELLKHHQELSDSCKPE